MSAQGIRMHTLPLGEITPAVPWRHVVPLAAAAAFLFLPSRGIEDLSAAILGPLCATAADGGSDARPRSTNVTVSSERLSHVPGKRVTVLRVTYPPGGHTPPHRHAGSVTAYVLSGQVRSQLNYGAIEIFQPGETFFEAPGVIQSISENASQTEPAELLAVFVHDEGATLTTLLD